MQQPQSGRSSAPGVPSFYLTSHQPFRPGVILPAILAAVGAVLAIVHAMSHSGKAYVGAPGAGAARSTAAAQGADSASNPDEDDDPTQIDTIVLGDPGEAPVPGRRGNHVSPVHPTIVVRLPRFGDQTGLIPDSPAGRLLYGWLAAFNQASYAGLGTALPTAAIAPGVDAQLELRRQTGGFNLLSAKEVEPGVLVFRIRDQTPAGMEALGTLQVSADSIPATIATFSIRAVIPAPPNPVTGKGPVAAELPR